MKATKDNFINIGVKLFQQQGFEKVSVEKICEECGVTKGSFYHHFRSKSELLLEYYNYLLKSPMSIMAEILSADSLKEQLWKSLEYSIDATIALGPDLLFHMLMADMSKGNHILSPYNTGGQNGTREYQELTFALIKKCQEHGDIHSGVEPKDLWFAYISGLIGIAVNWSSAKGNYNQKDELRRLFDIIFY